MPEDIPQQIASENKTYKVLKKLGQGGTSVVYLVEYGRQKLALKILGEHVDPVFVKSHIELLKNEFEVLSRLRHPNIARVYDFEYCPELDKYFFTTEYVEGTDILSFTRGTDFSTKEELYVQFLNALDHVHHNKLIHCDIKCSNILVTMVKKDPVVKLVDFGFATRHLGRSEYVIGTLHYLAPELVLQMEDIDARVDIYAAGIVLYRLLHGKYPCPYNTMGDFVRWHQIRGEFPYAEDIPDYIIQLINRMTARFPSQRISTPAQAIEFINNRTEGRYDKIVSKIVALMPDEGGFVGRENVLDRVNEIVESLKAKKTVSSNGLLFVGPEGIGKSRIIKEIKYRLELAGIPIREVACDYARDLVSDLIHMFKDVPSEELGSLDPTKPDPKRRFKLIRWVSDLVNIYKNKGLVLFIDDLHQANQPFLELLAELEKRLTVNKEEGSEIPIIIIAASRPEDAGTSELQRWWEAMSLEQMDVIPLSEEDVELYATSSGVRDYQKHKQAIWEFSGGVPQLVEAYCQHLLSPQGMARPPASLAHSYLDRINNVSSKAKKCLKILAVSHRNLTLDELANILGENRWRSCRKIRP